MARSEEADDVDRDNEATASAETLDQPQVSNNATPKAGLKQNGQSIDQCADQSSL